MIALFVISNVPVSVHGAQALSRPSPYSVSDVQVSGLIGHVWPSNGVLVGSTGDLIFALSASGFSSNRGWSTLAIMIPPEFLNILPEQVVSTITNDYANVAVRSLSISDRYGPGWTVVSVTADANTRRQFINFTTGGEWYYVRINGVVAPIVAGEYFFKMYLLSNLGQSELPSRWVPAQNWPVLVVNGALNPASIGGTIRYGGYNSTLNGSPILEAGKVLAHMTTKLDPSSGSALYTCLPLPQPPTPGCIDAVGYFNASAQGRYDLEGVAAGTYDIFAEAAGYPQQLIQPQVTVLSGQSLHFDGSLNPGVVIHGEVYSKDQGGDVAWPESTYVKIELYDAPTGAHHPDPRANVVSWSPLPCIAGGQASYMGGSHAGSCADPRLGSAIAFPWHEYQPNTGYTGYGVSDSKSVDNTPDPQGVGPPQHWFVAGGSLDPFHFQFGSRGEYGAPRDLDGHIPQIFATWVNGLTPGKYFVRAWVFRYVQSGFDGSTFQEYYFDVTTNEWAGDVSLPIDLQLSSWVDETVYFHNLQNTQTTSTINTGAGYVYGALEDNKGVVYSFNVTSLGYTNLTGTYRHNGYSTVLTKQLGSNAPNDPAGVNSNSLQSGQVIIQFWGINDTWNGDNYGIPSGTYNAILWATGYLQSTPTQVSLALGGNPTNVSDHMYRGAGFNLAISSTDWETPPASRNWVWNSQEIDVGIYQNNTFVDAFGDEPAFMANVALGGGCTKFGIRSLCSGSNLFQNNATSSLQVNGGGQAFSPNDNANWTFFGEEGEFQNVGGYADYLLAPFNTISQSSFAYLPTAFSSGQYDFRAWTYGYVQGNYVSVYAEPGQVANININLIIGVSLKADIIFAEEKIPTTVPADASFRARFFDESGHLVAEWMSSEGVYNTGAGNMKAADGTSGAPFGAGNGAAAETVTNYVPAGTTLLHLTVAGLPLVPHSGGMINQLYYGDPVFRASNPPYRKGWGNSFGVDQMIPSYFFNGGILGSPYYTGGWTIEIDMVNWHVSSTMYFPPPDGLLLGESYHNIPDTTAVSRISFTEDAALIFVGHTMSANHFGPYSQTTQWMLLGPPSGGSSSGEFEAYIGQSSSQIPEFQTGWLVSFLVVVASLWMLRRRRVTTSKSRSYGAHIH
jgi:hypothetical protein